MLICGIFIGILDNDVILFLGRYYDYIINVFERIYDENEDDIMLCEEEMEVERKVIVEKLRYKDIIVIIFLEKKFINMRFCFNCFLIFFS